VLRGFANPAVLSGFLCCELLSVAPYCALGGVRVVSEGRGLCVADPLLSTDEYERRWCVQAFLRLVSYDLLPLPELCLGGDHR
jgi:hypothetical protein